jgi:hypothetical protein
VGDVANVDELEGIMGCGVSPSKSIWNGNIKKIEHQLASWKIMYLSKGSRFALLTSTLSNFPTYSMSFPLLAGVVNCIEKLQRDFL